MATGAALGIATGGYSAATAVGDAASGLLCAGALSNATKLLRVAGSSRKLRKALQATGKVAAQGDEAHHIVAGGAQAARAGRTMLANLGIDINAAENGVFLSQGVHRSIHTTTYYQNVTSQLQQAQSKEEAAEILQGIARTLQAQAKK